MSHFVPLFPRKKGPNISPSIPKMSSKYGQYILNRARVKVQGGEILHSRAFHRKLYSWRSIRMWRAAREEAKDNRYAAARDHYYILRGPLAEPERTPRSVLNPRQFTASAPGTHYFAVGIIKNSCMKLSRQRLCTLAAPGNAEGGGKTRAMQT